MFLIRQKLENSKNPENSKNNENSQNPEKKEEEFSSDFFNFENVSKDVARQVKRGPSLGQKPVRWSSRRGPYNKHIDPNTIPTDGVKIRDFTKNPIKLWYGCTFMNQNGFTIRNIDNWQLFQETWKHRFFT